LLAAEKKILTWNAYHQKRCLVVEVVELVGQILSQSAVAVVVDQILQLIQMRSFQTWFFICNV